MKRLPALLTIAVPIAWWPREQRYAERLAPGTKFADIIGEIDPSKLAAGVSMSAEDALPLLCEWNRRCQPEWTLAELRHKLSDAVKKRTI